MRAHGRRGTSLLLLPGFLVLMSGCSWAEEPSDPATQTRTRTQPQGSVTPTEFTRASTRASTTASPTTGSPTTGLMPDLVGMPSAEAGELLADLGLGSSWGRPVTVGCEARPRTVLRQRPAAGAPLEAETTVHLRTAALDLARFRGPCEAGEQPGDVAGTDAAVARAFYRFAADPSLDAPFAPGGVWVGIEDGPTATRLPAARLGDLGAWELDTEYAERSGPFSALDTVAASGGHYQLSDGVAATCPAGNDQPPEALAGQRALSLTSPDDVTSACLEWWGVTLFLDGQDRIAGVALRLGSP